MAEAVKNNDVDRIDVEGLRVRYAEERAIRLKPSMNKQYVGVEEIDAVATDDPYVDAPAPRSAVHETVEALLIGGGFGGLLAAAELIGIGIGVDQIRMVEKAGDFGGTWYWNRYPGAQCDTESYIYMPLLEETGYIPTEKYARAPELFAHAQRAGRHFGLYERALFETQVTRLAWSEEDRRWIATTDRGDEIRARYVLSASGPLNKPKLPGIPGIETFEGHMFHTSRWDYYYTGGGQDGGLDKLADKRVAIIGTGATAVQCVPFVARDAKHLYVIQRTPSTVGPRGNAVTDPKWAETLVPGWQRERMDNFNLLTSGVPVERDLVQDGWTHFFGRLAPVTPTGEAVASPEEAWRQMEIADLHVGEELRARVDQFVTDPETAAGLKAWYGLKCKRPTFNDDFLPAFNRDNVTLVDTRGEGLHAITKNGIVFDGVEHEVDCIIFATGFEVGTDYSRRAGVEIVGVGGRTLAEHFTDGLRSLHGMQVSGFPNLFMLVMGQNGFKVNATDMLSEQVEHIGAIIAHSRAIGATRVEASAEAEAAWLDTLREKSGPLRAALAVCTPGYYNGEGDIDNGLLTNLYGGGAPEFSALLDHWRQRGDYEGLVLT